MLLEPVAHHARHSRSGVVVTGALWWGQVPQRAAHSAAAGRPLHAIDPAGWSNVGRAGGHGR